MDKPWNRPPLPSTADTDATALYAGVGKVMSEWEGIETQLYRIFSFLCFAPDDRQMMQRYGEERIFLNRFTQLKAEAYKLFCKRHNQEIEGDFDTISAVVEGYSGRRNDVAHGIVQNVNYYAFFTDKAGPLVPFTNYWLILPALYKWPGNSLQASPPFAYNSVMLEDLVRSLSEVYAGLTDLREKLRAFVNQ